MNTVCNHKKQAKVSSDRLKQLLSYNETTGIFTRIVGRGNRRAGSEAGGKNISDGYHRIYVDGYLYRTHRLAWLYVYGEWPDDQIDHINQNKADNRICNLRAVTRSENQKNYPKKKNNKSGVTGVYRRYNRWVAQIGVNGTKIHLGCFHDIADAAEARKMAEIKYGFHKNHGVQPASDTAA